MFLPDNACHGTLLLLQSSAAQPAPRRAHSQQSRAWKTVHSSCKPGARRSIALHSEGRLLALDVVLQHQRHGGPQTVSCAIAQPAAKQKSTQTCPDLPQGGGLTCSCPAPAGMAEMAANRRALEFILNHQKTRGWPVFVLLETAELAAEQKSTGPRTNTEHSAW